MAENEENENENGLTVLNAGIATMADAASIKDFRKRMESFTKRINTAPPTDKILSRSEGGETYQYLPISYIENKARRDFFGLAQFEIIDFTHVLNEVVVTARIKVFHPVLMQWLNYDGIGAGTMQQDAKTAIIDFMQHKKKNALKLAAPIAYAEAIKNAAKKIGKAYGSDLNRKHEDFYKPQIKDDEDNKPIN